MCENCRFPYIKTLEDFNFSYQPSINRGQIFDFKNLRFLERKEIFFSLEHQLQGKRIWQQPLEQKQLKRAHLENRLETRLKFFAKYKLLIIDEVGFLPLDSESSRAKDKMSMIEDEDHNNQNW